MFFAVIRFNANAQITGFSDKSYDFENGSPENWTQRPGFSSSTDRVASGKKGMKAEFKDYGSLKKGPKLQSFRNKNLADGKFDIKAGTYKMTVKVYIEGEAPRHLYVELKSAPGKKSPRFERLDRLEKNSWHTITATFAVEKDFKNDWMSIRFTNLPNSGAGTIYIDDLDISTVN